MTVAAVATKPVRQEIVSIFEEVFQHEDVITPETLMEDVARWDSLRHVALVSSLEETFGISLSMDEMMEIRSVADIELLLERHRV